MTQASAPGKVYFFGEHAVVYGKPAIACAIDLRTNVGVKSSRDDSVYFVSNRKKIHIQRSPYIHETLKILSENYDIPLSGFRLIIKSTLPKASGLGSSAALVIATIGAISEEFGLNISREHIASIGHEVEKNVQGRASPTDTYISTFGGVYRMPDKVRLPTPQLTFVIGDTKTSSSTKELVEHVANLRQRYGFVDNIINAIGELCREGERYFVKGDVERIGELMLMNHSLLEVLGVGSRKLRKLVDAAMEGGAYGAKLTGAGGGGCIISITCEDRVDEISDRIKRCGGRAYVVHPTDEGLVL
jgi:mevalonate kinase